MKVTLTLDELNRAVAEFVDGYYKYQSVDVDASSVEVITETPSEETVVLGASVEVREVPKEDES